MTKRKWWKYANKKVDTSSKDFQALQEPTSHTHLWFDFSVGFSSPERENSRDQGSKMYLNEALVNFVQKTHKNYTSGQIQLNQI